MKPRAWTCSPFQSVEHRLHGTQPVLVRVHRKSCGLSCRHLRLRCLALDPRGSQQPFVARPGSGDAVLPFIHTEDESRTTVSQSAEPATAAPVSEPRPSESWDSWLRTFERLDKACEQQAFLKQRLQDAVRQEQYSQAAACKQELDAVQSLDAVAAVQASLQQALEDEQYEQAAALRDQGMAWVQGWWRGVSADDPVGHLMHVVPEFGRYTGRVYTARDVAALAGLRAEVVMSGGLQQLRAAIQNDSSTLRSTGQVGTPAVEVFLSQEGDSLRHQVVSLMGPAQQLKQVSQPTYDRPPSPLGSRDQIGSLAAMLGLGLLMRLSVTVDSDGSAVLKASPVDNGNSKALNERNATRNKLVGWDAVEAAEEGLNSNRSSLLSDSDEEGSPSTSNSGQGTQPGTSSDGVSSSASVSSQRPDNKLSDSEQAIVAAALDSLRMTRAERRAAAAEAAAAAEDSAGQMLVDVAAARAVEIDATRSGDSMDGDDYDSHAAAMRARSHRDSDSNDMPHDHDEDSNSGFTELHRRPADLERLSVDQFVLRVPVGAAAASAAAGAASTSSRGFDDVPQVRFEILVPAGKLMLSGANGSERAAATVTAVAERVARAQARRGGRSVDPDALRAGLQTLLRSLEAGKPVEVVIPAFTSDPMTDSTDTDTPTTSTSTRDAAAASSEPQATAVRYTRIPAESSPRSDPFSGLYVGSFGPHGPELLRLRRLVVDGEEMVEATKITGDTNVPAGKVSFRAKIGRKHKQSASQVYPDELGVTARYKGQGHVAGKGYSRPKWVEGELLVFSSNSPLTNGAQLGFVWHVPGERKFLILLNKVDLEECIERSQQSGL